MPLIDGSVVLHHGDCLQVMRGMADNSVDAIVTDPPYDLTNRVPDVKKCRDFGGQDGKPDACPRCGGELYNQRSQGKGFMGKDWDGTGIAFDPATWVEALRVLKPGGHLLSFGGTRTYHRMAVAIEDAGFEIRDQLQWLYGSGFPKSLSVSKSIDKAAGAEREVVRQYSDNGRKVPKHQNTHGAWTGNEIVSVTVPATPEAQQWDGWGTALKPAHEPIVLARKPFKGTVAANVLAHGTGALNVDGSRIGTTKRIPSGNSANKSDITYNGGWGPRSYEQSGFNPNIGRWPANVLFDEAAAALLDEQSAPNMHGAGKARSGEGVRTGKNASMFAGDHEGNGSRYGDTGGASRFFKVIDEDAPRFVYVSKASRRERNAGLEGMPEKTPWTSFDGQYAEGRNPVTGERTGQYKREQSNHHPTVKPIKLMRYLCKLITPPGGIVLDPFMGSGSTGCAALTEGFGFIGIDAEEEYVEIARKRIAEIQSRPMLPIKDITHAAD